MELLPAGLLCIQEGKYLRDFPQRIKVSRPLELLEAFTFDGEAVPPVEHPSLLLFERVSLLRARFREGDTGDLSVSWGLLHSEIA